MVGEFESSGVAARPSDRSPERRESKQQIADLRAELAIRRETLGLSFVALAAAVDRPVSTVHGWLAGTHVPYPRDRETFERVLTVLGVENPRETLRRLSLARRASESDSERIDLRGRLERLERRVADLECGRTA